MQDIRSYMAVPVRRLISAAFLAAASEALVLKPSVADEGGVSFWLPGSFASLAAVPGTPGWSLGTIYLHSDVSGGGKVAASRALNVRGRQTNLTVSLDAKLRGTADLGVLAPAYTFETPVLGGQLTLGALIVGGRSAADIDANISGALGPIGFARERRVSDSLAAFGDVFLQPMLRWNQGVNNYMVYGMVNLPVGAYRASRLVNLGLGHWAIDGGGGYTYFNPQTGREFSAVAGLTYNFTNPSTHYQNGIDFHLDWGASQFVSKQLHLGVAGYAYQQLTGDSGSGDTLGSFKSRVFGIGPQAGYLFPIAGMQGYLNLKAYGEFGAKNRAQGWNVWLTFAISAAPPPQHPAALLVDD